MRGKSVSKKYLIIGIIAILVIMLGVVTFILLKPGTSNSQCSVSAGEWAPQQGECPGTTSEMQAKCNAFCSSHPDCCPDWNENAGGQGQTALSLPLDSEINSLTRSYITTIKAINEGPLIYSQSASQEIISDDELDKIKEAGFNTIQVLLIGKWEGDKIVFNDVNNAVLLNDIIAIKKKGMAVWVALDLGGGAPQQGMLLAESYEKFKNGFTPFVEESSKLMEKYQVEYLTAVNEADMFFNLQTSWGTESQINDYLIDFYPSMNEIARSNFNGKIINKMTQPEKRTNEFIMSTFSNIDIAGVDVGPYVGDNFDMSIYKEGLQGFQLYATKASAAGIKWMNSEYWLSNFGEATSSQKTHQLECVNEAIKAYENSSPAGVGFTYNEFASFSWQPYGEQTRLAIKNFLEKI